ncbi:hypothetical protein BGZ61DRAFT_588952 [Ilyonectria robusta]|uniref:uncharacterized protein n=1 Tax=Ilyonectria robusta TaxID=1079257 RepID=UPI001E8D0A22|nr:uncharacterized protein BGZ61DRAFT_588952 [Ilyonectria robusta]KAH8688359.1 hypothetical protein BGZ61DRAFT_588952 [Ilyonectria robusta]
MRVLEIPRSELIAAPDQQCDEATLRVALAVCSAYAISPLCCTPEALRILKEYFQGDASTFTAADFSLAHNVFCIVVEDLGRWANLDAEQIITPLVIINAFDVYSILSEISGPVAPPSLHRQASTGQQAFGGMLGEFEGKIQSARTLVEQAMGEVDTTIGWVQEIVCAAENVQAGLGQVHQQLEVVDNGTLDMQIGRENLDYIKERLETVSESM